MAARKDSERLNQALQTLHDVRGELSFEAAWLRDRLSPAKVAHRTMDHHTPLVLCISFGGGLLAAMAAFHKSKPQPLEIRLRDGGIPPAKRKGALAAMASSLFAAAVPLALKLATSKPVVTKLLDAVMPPQRRPVPQRAEVS